MPTIQNLRRQPRLPISLYVNIWRGSAAWPAVTEDVGTGGCLVRTDRPLVVPARLHLRLRSEHLGETFSVPARVAWTSALRSGLAFIPGPDVARERPQEWFARLLATRSRVAPVPHPAPPELDHAASLYLRPPPRHLLDLTPDEVELLRRADHGTTVGLLLSASGLPEPRAVRALFGLFEKQILTLAMGQAGEAWRWRALLGANGTPARPPLRAEPEARPCPAVPSPSHAPRAPASPPWPSARVTAADPTTVGPIGRLATPVPAGRVVSEAAQEELLRGSNLARRPREAQALLDEAVATARSGSTSQAVALLRRALSLAPRDPQIAALLGQLAFKGRALA